MRRVPAALFSSVFLMVAACGSDEQRAVAQTTSMTDGEPTTEERFARLALDCIHRPYPNKISHVMASDDDVAPPRELTPAFYGCFDFRHIYPRGYYSVFY